MAEEKSPQQLVKESAWVATSRTVILAAVFGAGFYTGYLKWGDAPRLEKQVNQLKDQIVTLRNEREEMKSKEALLRRDLDSCEDDLGEAKAAAAAPAEPES